MAHSRRWTLVRLPVSIHRPLGRPIHAAYRALLTQGLLDRDRTPQNPQKSKFVARWEIALWIALLFTAIVTPYEVGFIDQTDEVDAFFVANRIVDVIFAIDICLQFMLMYPRSTGVMHGEKWENDPATIRRHYLTTWFTVDALALLVSVIDVLALVLNRQAAEQPGALVANGTSTGLNDQAGDAIKVLRVILRLLRAARLLKMLRLVRLKRLLKNFLSRLAINYSMFKLVQCIVGVFAASHWFACIWGLQAAFQETRASSWMGEFGYCELTSPPAGGPPTAECMHPFALYIASFYWSVMTITSIGYGDIAASTGHTAEQALCAVLMLAGGIIWANVIGELVGVVATVYAPRVLEHPSRSPLTPVSYRTAFASLSLSLSLSLSRDNRCRLTPPSSIAPWTTSTAL